MCAKQRIALYGGTFDPVHLGHLDVAREVSRLFEIAKVIFIPAQVAPHKLGRPVTPSIHRYTMLALATQDEASFLVSTFEIEAPDRRYTVDTLDHFIHVFGETSELFFIMGADSWIEITTWREWQRLLTMVNHIVVTRPGYPLDTVTVMKDRVVDMRSKSLATGAIEEGTKIYLTDVVMRDVSATQIRASAGERRFEELAQLVSVPVATYIQKYALYQDTNEA